MSNITKTPTKILANPHMAIDKKAISTTPNY